MRSKIRLPMAALLLAAVPLAAWAQEKKDVAPGDIQYHAAPSALAGVPMVQSTNPKAPQMTLAEFDSARKIYFERCAGCHGVLRKGATGKPLTPDITLGKGTDYLSSVRLKVEQDQLVSDGRACGLGSIWLQGA